MTDDAFAQSGHLDLLGSWFGHAYAPRAVIEDEIGAWAHRYPHNRQIVGADWLRAVPVDVASDIVEVERIRREHFGSAQDKDYGEAEVVVLCQRHGWTAALDDDVARRYAARPDVAVPSVMMLTIIVAAAAEGLIASKHAWKVHVDVDDARGGGRSFLTGKAVHRAAFLRSVDAFRTIGHTREPGAWPAILKLRGLDDVVRGCATPDDEGVAPAAHQLAHPPATVCKAPLHRARAPGESRSREAR